MRLPLLLALATSCSAPPAVSITPASTDGAAVPADLSAHDDLATAPSDGGTVTTVDLSALADLSVAHDLLQPAEHPDLSPAPPDGARVADMALPSSSPDGGP